MERAFLIGMAVMALIVGGLVAYSAHTLVTIGGLQ